MEVTRFLKKANPQACKDKFSHYRACFSKGFLSADERLQLFEIQSLASRPQILQFFL